MQDFFSISYLVLEDQPQAEAQHKGKAREMYFKNLPLLDLVDGVDLLENLYKMTLQLSPPSFLQALSKSKIP